MIISPQSRSSIGLGKPLYRSVPTAANEIYLIALIVLTLFHFWLASYLPPSEDELYYWAWANHLQGSYFDHPPLVAYLIALSTRIFGDTIFGIRFFACLGGFVAFLGIGRLMPQKDLLTFLLASPIFFLGAVLMTPDVPLIVCWVLYVLWLVRANEALWRWSLDPVSRVYRSSPVGWLNWIAGGVLLGLGGLSKYTMVLAVPCTFLVLATRTRARAWLGGFAVHLAVAGLVCLPVFLFNRAHGGLPFAFQWNHAMGDARPAAFFGFVGSQILLLGGLPFLLLPWILARTSFLLSDSRSQVCYFFFVVPFLFFLLQAMRGPLEANWALVAYPTFWPLAGRLLHQNSFKALGRGLLLVSFALPVVASFLFLIHSLLPLGFVPPAKDRLALLRARYAVSKSAAEYINAHYSTLPLFTPTYQWTSYFRFQKLEAQQLPGIGRPSEFTLSPVSPCGEKSVIVFEPSGVPASALQGALTCFAHRESLRQYTASARGEKLETYELVSYYR